jgi:hypothetical protein
VGSVSGSAGSCGSKTPSNTDVARVVSRPRVFRPPGDQAKRFGNCLTIPSVRVSAMARIWSR